MKAGCTELHLTGGRLRLILCGGLEVDIQPAGGEFHVGVLRPDAALGVDVRGLGPAVVGLYEVDRELLAVHLEFRVPRLDISAEVGAFEGAQRRAGKRRAGCLGLGRAVIVSPLEERQVQPVRPRDGPGHGLVAAAVGQLRFE